MNARCGRCGTTFAVNAPGRYPCPGCGVTNEVRSAAGATPGGFPPGGESGPPPGMPPVGTAPPNSPPPPPSAASAASAASTRGAVESNVMPEVCVFLHRRCGRRCDVSDVFDRTRNRRGTGRRNRS